MASFHSNQVLACSKAQASLNKILQTIISVKPPRTVDIDLNLSLVDACWEFDGDGEGEYENDNFDACSFIGNQIESDSSGNNGEKTKEGSCSDITNLNEETKEYHATKPFEEQNGDDCFGLLIAAADLISSTEAESSQSTQDLKEVTREKTSELLLSAGESTRDDLKNCPTDVDDTSASAIAIAPVVRSKRGRNRVLPYRYRDSVLLLEPYKRRREAKMKRQARIEGVENRICNDASAFWLRLLTQ